MGVALAAAAQAYGTYSANRASANALPGGPFDASIGLDQRTYFGVPAPAMQAAVLAPPSFQSPAYGAMPIGGDSTLLLILAAGAIFVLRG